MTHRTLRKPPPDLSRFKREAEARRDLQVGGFLRQIGGLTPDQGKLLNLPGLFQDREKLRLAGQREVQLKAIGRQRIEAITKFIRGLGGGQGESANRTALSVRSARGSRVPGIGRRFVIPRARRRQQTLASRLSGPGAAVNPSRGLNLQI